MSYSYPFLGIIGDVDYWVYLCHFLNVRGLSYSDFSGVRTSGSDSGQNGEGCDAPLRTAATYNRIVNEIDGEAEPYFDVRSSG